MYYVFVIFWLFNTAAVIFFLYFNATANFARFSYVVILDLNFGLLIFWLGGFVLKGWNV